jgi:hypothetical protein
MDVSRKNDLTKIMWLPDQQEILFQMKTEESLSLASKHYKEMYAFIDLDNWRNSYGQAYGNWLNKDDHRIYDINDDVNLIMISALAKANEALNQRIFFYWFDVDRTDNEKFNWEYCPISKKRLVKLGPDFPKINSLVSPDYPLVFPL